MDHIKTAEKVSHLYHRIKIFDEEIIKIEQMAEALSKGTFGVTLQMSIEQPPKEDSKPNIDNGGSEYRSTMNSMMYGFRSYAPEKKEEKNELSIKNYIAETMAFSVLDFMLRDKIEKRENLLRQLEKATLNLKYISHAK